MQLPLVRVCLFYSTTCWYSYLRENNISPRIGAIVFPELPAYIHWKVHRNWQTRKYKKEQKRLQNIGPCVLVMPQRASLAAYFVRRTDWFTSSREAKWQ
jgi:hypothetical protein